MWKQQAAWSLATLADATVAPSGGGGGFLFSAIFVWPERSRGGEEDEDGGFFSCATSPLTRADERVPRRQHDDEAWRAEDHDPRSRGTSPSFEPAAESWRGATHLRFAAVACHRVPSQCARRPVTQLVRPQHGECCQPAFAGCPHRHARGSLFRLAVVGSG